MYSESKNIVSVFMLAYNQEAYIKQTINSILNQKTTFPFNIVIGEDCSTDGTLNIIKDFQKQNPERIKIITSENNIGLIKNFIRTIKSCDGKYIAICDGDDFWIDENKLQTQVDFLESNKDFSIVFTNKNDLYKNNIIVSPKANKLDTSEFKDLVKGNYIASVTTLFKNNFYKKEMPKWLEKYPYGDWPIYLLTVNDGSKIKFLNKITANYRKDTGITSNMRKKSIAVNKTNLNILKDIYHDKTFFKNKKTIKESIINHKINLMKAFIRSKQFIKAITLYMQLLPNTNFLYLSKQFFKTLYKSIL